MSSRYLKARLREPSTWVGLAQVIGGAAHAYTQGGQVAAIAAIALGVAGMAIPDRAPPPTAAPELAGGPKITPTSRHR